MKWWQIAWLAIVMVWGNALVGIFALMFIREGFIYDVQQMVVMCLAFFTLPAAGLYLVCAGMAWAMPRLARGIKNKGRRWRVGRQPQPQGS